MLFNNIRVPLHNTALLLPVFLQMDQGDPINALTGHMKGHDMRKTILNITLAGAVAIAGFGASPAVARDNELLGQVLFGAIALGILGAAINDKNQKRNQATVQTHQNPTHTSHNNRKVLPAQCVRRHRTDQGRVRLANQRCLKRNDVRVNRLPDRCHMRIETRRNEIRRGFHVGCLKRRGFTFR